MVQKFIAKMLLYTPSNLSDFVCMCVCIYNISYFTRKVLLSIYKCTVQVDIGRHIVHDLLMFIF